MVMSSCQLHKNIYHKMIGNWAGMRPSKYTFNIIIAGRLFSAAAKGSILLTGNFLISVDVTQIANTEKFT